MRRQLRMRQEPRRLVFIDATAVKTDLMRLRGRTPVKERFYGAAPSGKWGTQTFVAGLTQDALIAPWVIKGAMNGAAFDAYIETQPAPVLDPGTVVILDNLSTHKSPRAAEAMRKRGCWFLFLSAYSPDLDPIEMAFSKLKVHLRRIDARTFDAVFDALGDICNMFHPEECWNFLKAAGYASDQMQNALKPRVAFALPHSLAQLDRDIHFVDQSFCLAPAVVPQLWVSQDTRRSGGIRVDSGLLPEIREQV